MEVLKPYVDAHLVEIVNGKKHAKVVRLTDGFKFSIPSTPSDHRTLLNFKAQLRRFAGPLQETSNR